MKKSITLFFAQSRVFLLVGLIGLVGLTTFTAQGSPAPDVFSCQVCCDNRGYACDQGVYNTCAAPIIASCEGNGGSESECFYEAQVACQSELNACQDTQSACEYECYNDDTYCE